MFCQSTVLFQSPLPLSQNVFSPVFLKVRTILQIRSGPSLTYPKMSVLFSDSLRRTPVSSSEFLPRLVFGLWHREFSAPLVHLPSSGTCDHSYPARVWVTWVFFVFRHPTAPRLVPVSDQDGEVQCTCSCSVRWEAWCQRSRQFIYVTIIVEYSTLSKLSRSSPVL